MPTLAATTQLDSEHANTPGVLLVNLGTPDAPTTQAVRRYLKQFLWDPRVVDYPRWLWWLILNGIILRVRPAKSAAAYREVWTERGSPLLFHSADLANALQSRLAGDARVELAMTYGNPSVAAGLDRLLAAGVSRIVVLPLYPQYSGTTTAAVADAVSAAIANSGATVAVHVVDEYYDLPSYARAHANNIRAFWAAHDRGDTLLFSFHGIPERLINNGDPYYCQCVASAQLIAAELGLNDDEWSVAFQSRVGRERWLQPYTDEVLRALGQQGMARVDVACPGFAVDCLETLEEIAMRYAEEFVAAGGGALHYIPALNASDGHAALLAEVALQNIASVAEQRRE